MAWRFAVGSISHETNSFSPIKTELAHFKDRGYFKGEAILTEFTGTRTPIGGFIDFAEETDSVLVPVISASAVPSGIVSKEAYLQLKEELLQGIKSAGEIDGVLLALHGAMVADGFPDAEGDILTSVRQIVGSGVPVVATLDFHATVTDVMVEKANGLFGYNTYPHVDGYERGLEAGRFAAKVLRKEINPVNVVIRPPLAPAVVPARTGWGPIKELMEQSFEFEKEPGVLNVSVYGGFVYSDVYDAGLAFLATTDGDRARAQNIAERLTQKAWALRHSFVADMKKPQDAVKYAMSKDKGPVILADVADNTGGGASGDGTEILQALIEHNAQDAVVITMPDKEAVDAAFKAGVGGNFDALVGGKFDDLHGAPVRVQGTVRLLSDGSFVHRGPMSTGVKSSIGRSAVIQCGGIDIIVNERRSQPVDPEVARSVGIDPTFKKIVVVKSAVHYRAAYEPIASEIIEVDGPGLSSPNLSRFEFKNIRRPVFPIDEDMKISR
ncbi:MAG: M81 family metallopeptidase [Bacillota bacterium]